tara:strand:- start:10313 stop:11626 length:1314 start_codon:yes stop_codon:yes gene_type:complete
MNLLTKIKSKNFTAGIIGLGYVGLPLAYAFCSKNIKTLGFDINLKQTKMLNNKKSYLKHIPDEKISQMISKGFKATTDFKNIKDVDVIIICVPTPLDHHKEPDLSAIIKTGQTIAPFMKKNQLIVLESSTFPGTTDENLAKSLEKSNLEKNKDYYLAYSPEREDPGNKEYTTSTIPKIVGADSERAQELVYELYNQITDSVIQVRGTRTAEAVKLTENIFRSVNIALVNELKIIFNAMDIDVWEVIEGASSKPFGYMPFYPGPGLGGHCIPIDPFYLSYKAREFGLIARFIELSGEINTQMPNLVVNKLTWAMNDNLKKPLNGSKVLIIGIAYKKDIDDIRESPSLVMIESLKSLGASTDYHDEFVPEIPATREHKSLEGMKSVPLNEKTLKAYDAVLICTNHSYISYQDLANNALLILDTRNAMKNITGKAIIIKG